MRMKFMSNRTILVTLLLLSISWNSLTEHTDRPDGACTPHTTTTLRNTQPLSTDHTIRIDEHGVVIDVITNQEENDRGLHTRGGHVDSSSSISGHPTTDEATVYHLNSHLDGNSHSANSLIDPTVTLSSLLSFSLTQPGDGSQSDPDGIPTRFMLMQKGHRGNAIQALHATKAWREKYSVDTILSRPHPNYDVYKAIFPVYLAGRDPTGHIIVVEQLGKINDELAKRKNISMDEVLIHFVYMVEYCWNILDRPPHNHLLGSIASTSSDLSGDNHPRSSPGTMVTIMDCEGVAMSTLLGFGKTASENRKFLLNFVQTVSENYPLRGYKTLVVNVPDWLSGIYNNLIRPLLKESAREKIKLYKAGKEQDEVLSALGLNYIYRENSVHTDAQQNEMNENVLSMARESPMEQELRNFVS